MIPQLGPLDQHGKTHESGGRDAIQIDNLAAADDNTDLNVTSTAHGLAPKSPGDATKFLNGAATPDYALVKDSDLSLSDITTNDASTSKHGFLKKLSNVATEYMAGDGNWTALLTAILSIDGSGSGLDADLLDGLNSTAFLRVSNNLSDVNSVSSARTNLGLGTGDSPQFAALNVGDAADTTIARVSAGVIAVEGSNVLLASNIGVTVQAYDADLATWATLTPSANAQSLVTAANYAAMRALLDLEAGTDFPSQATFDDHSARHESGGADAIQIDNLAAPDDNTDLNASTSAHGLLKKLSNVSTEFMNGQGNWATPAGATAASQAEEEAASSTTVFTTPGRQHFHPGVLKNWLYFNGATNAANGGYNSDGVTTDHGTGDWTVGFVTDFADTNYSVSIDSSTYCAFASTKAVGSIRVGAASHDGTAADATQVYVETKGDFA